MSDFILVIVYYMLTAVSYTRKGIAFVVNLVTSKDSNLQGQSLAGSNNRDPKTPLTKEEKAVVEKRILEIRSELGITKGQVTLANIAKILTWYLKSFNYQSDAVTFGKEDFWNTLAFEWFLLDGILWDDCDSGYVLIAAIILIIGISDRTRVCRVSCRTETGEGHFVVWVKSDSNIWYQVENRIRVPRTVKYMRDMGYQYWHYSTMAPKDIKTNKWYSAEARAAKIIYETPAGLEADEVIEDMTTEEVISAIPKSRTMQFGTGVGATTISGSVIALASQADWKIVAMFLLAGLAIAGGIFYFRLVTVKPIRFTRDAK